MEGKPIDFRVSTVPGKWGEKVCMRILDKSNTTIGLDKVVTHAETLKLIRELINQPYGIIYVTGPTGSGKTTTLYSSLNEINSQEINISTAEDPIEYDLGGLCQVQTHKDIGLDFARVTHDLLPRIRAVADRGFHLDIHLAQRFHQFIDITLAGLHFHSRRFLAKNLAGHAFLDVQQIQRRSMQLGHCSRMTESDSIQVRVVQWQENSLVHSGSRRFRA